MRPLRLALSVLGLGVFGVAVAVAFVPGVGGGGLTERLLAVAGNDYVPVAVVGAAAIVLTALALLVRGVRGLDQATPPDPEEIQTAPHPGVEFDRVVDEGFGLRARLLSDEGERVRERLRETAIRAEMRGTNCSRSEAKRSIERGEWTDDRAAAVFLAGQSGPAPGLDARLRAALRGESWFQHGARRAARSIARAEGGERS